MGALPRPALPPGAQHDLVDALHELHHRAGWPSLRTLAKAAGCSHTTVSTVFSSPRLPSWGLLELIVEHLDGDVALFHRLWVEAGPTGSTTRTPTQLAGRTSELAAVRRHLESGTGLLVVTGEAGIGKSRLVTAAVASTEALVSPGACLPLSQAVSLMPVADALAAAWVADGGLRTEQVLTSCPARTRTALGRLLPELEAPTGAEPDQRQVFQSVERLLVGTEGVARLTLVLDDLHWADPATLDLLEHLVARRAPVGLVGTWRLDDPSIPEATRAWWERVRRHPVSILRLGPLDRGATIELLAGLGVDTAPDFVDRVYQRSRGQPLFTEQLAVHGGGDDELPDLLAELLDRRLSELGGDAGLVTTMLGVADRPLTVGDLTELTEVPGDRLDAALHELSERYLLAARPADVALRHPLLAEAARGRLLPHERAAVHRRLAERLGRSASPPAAEVAEHWRAAGDPAHELVWREAAARAADARASKSQAATEWLRVLELWPDDGTRSPAERADALIETMRSLSSSARIEQAGDLVQPALALVQDVDPARAAQLYLWAGDVTGALVGTEQSIPLFEQALEQQSLLPPSTSLVAILSRMSGQLRGAGSYAAAAGLVRRAVEVSSGLDNPLLLRQQLQLRAWHETVAGDREAAAATMREALATSPGTASPDPVWEGVIRTDMLLVTAGSLAEVRAVAEPAIAFAQSEEVESYQTCLLVSNLAQALVHAGRVAEAAQLIDPVTDGPFTLDRWPAFIERVLIDSLRGADDHARAALDLVDGVPITSAGNQAERAERGALMELWRSDAEAAAARLASSLVILGGSEASGHAGPLLVLAARAAADQSHGRPAPAAVGQLVELRRSLMHDPLADDAAVATHTAQAAQWAAELSRLEARPDPAPWLAAASHWDQLERPHDAAYCRWRGAEAALATGQGTLARRLLRRAALDAREHVPLTRAITETAAYAQHPQKT
jgi:hypothetical protein